MASIKGMSALAALLATALLGVACGSPTTTGSSCSKTYNVGLVTDVGKLSDKSFNANAWQGVQDAVNDSSLCVKAKVIESNQPTDYQKNMQLFIDQKYDMVVTVGFLLGDDTLAVAKANPTVKFAIVDYAYDKPPAHAARLVRRADPAGVQPHIAPATTTKSATLLGV